MSTELEERMEQAQVLKLHNENTRQSIGVLTNILSAGTKTGEGYSQEIVYVISDPINRGIIETKILSLIDRL